WTLWRTDGATNVPVRGASERPLTDRSSTVVYDREAPYNRPVTYYLTYQQAIPADPAPLRLETLSPQRVGRMPAVVPHRVMQAVCRSEETGEFYRPQGDEDTPGVEDAHVSRCRSDGVRVDSMKLAGAGHGSCFALQHIGGTVHVWVRWTGGYLVRLPYAA